MIYNNLHLDSREQSQSAIDTQPSQQSPRDHFLRSISNRKQSHELNQLRNQCNTDEERIKKLVNFSMTKKIEQQRGNQLQQVSGRDDPANVLGFRKLNIGPSTAKNSTRQRRN